LAADSKGQLTNRGNQETGPPDPSKPSGQFEEIIRMNIATKALPEQKAKAASAAPQIP